MTIIMVPAIVYPGGYKVAVTGGKVVSAPNEMELRIAASSGATSITAVVTPA